MRGCRNALILALSIVSLFVLRAHAGDNGEIATSNGPDVIVSNIEGAGNYTCAVPNSNPTIYQACVDPIDRTKIDAISVGTRACNLGSSSLSWNADTAAHPVIRSGMFRLLNGRFEQIGTSWVKHGFLATNDANTCQSFCAHADENGFELFPGCSDVYDAPLNGGWSSTGPASEINAFTGENPGPPAVYLGVKPVDARLQVHYSDLNPTTNPGALYFLQAHYVTADDAAAGNADNNASYRRALVTYDAAKDTYNVNITSSTRDQAAVISAWNELDPGVDQVNARVPGEGLFIVSARATILGANVWHYEYAVENLNSDRSAGSFAVPLPPHAMLQNIGFHDVDYHSGEPYARDDWTAAVVSDAITWSTEPFDQNPNANALRWSTIYNFRFDADVPPADSLASIGLFKPGLPAGFILRTQGPMVSPTGDFDSDDNVDLEDIAALQQCFSDRGDLPDFVTPSMQCLVHFDFDRDGDVDGADLNAFLALFNGP